MPTKSIFWACMAFCVGRGVHGADGEKMPQENEKAYTHVFFGVLDFLGDGKGGPGEVTEKVFNEHWIGTHVHMANFMFKDVKAIKGNAAERINFSPAETLFRDHAYWTNGEAPLALTPGRRYVVAVRLADPDVALASLRDFEWERISIFDVDETEADLVGKSLLAGDKIIDGGKLIAERRGGAWFFRVDDYRKTIRGMKEGVDGHQISYVDLLKKYGRPLVVWGRGDDKVAAYVFATDAKLGGKDADAGANAKEKPPRFDDPSSTVILIHLDKGKATGFRAVWKEFIQPAS